MKIAFGIKERIFIVIAILVIILSFSISHLLKQVSARDRLIADLTENYQFSLTRLEELKDKFGESVKTYRYMLISPSVNREVFLNDLKILYEDVIPPVSNSLVEMSVNWIEEDRKVIIETSRLLLDSLYFEFLDYSSVVDFDIYSSGLNEEEIDAHLANSGILFLISEIEQNINYLIDKRIQEISSVNEEISHQTRELRRLIIAISAFSVIFLLFAIVYLLSHLRKFIGNLASKLEKLANGNIPENIRIDNKSEFFSVTANLNKLFDYLRKLKLVAIRISEKNFSTEFQPLGNEDELGNAMINLQDSLKKAHNEEKKYKKEESERLWKSNSIALVNDILREEVENITELGSKLCREIVRLIDGSLAGLFIIRGQEDPKIELIASHAYNRRKTMEKSFRVGEGLIGRCVQENETIYLTDIPENHIKILTGLGESEPVSLLIVPLKLNDQVFGVIEIASLHEIENYKINFVETIGENIATTFANLQANIRTAQLLEQTRQQAEEMQSQEEEMRQNMEELKATQEELAQREEKLKKEIEELKKKEDSI